MIHWDDKDGLLSLAHIVPGHNLREVRELPGFDSWGVDYKPGSWPDVLWIGDGSNDFNSKCYPFMAAHEALHSIATLYTELDDYQFFLYNICEDWRVNTCLLGIYGRSCGKLRSTEEGGAAPMAEQASPAQISNIHSPSTPLLHESHVFPEGACSGECQRLFPRDAVSARRVR